MKEFTFWTSFPALVIYWILLTLFVMAPYVFGGRLIAPGADAIAQFYPAMYWFSETIKTGDSILWDQAIFSGFPAYLSQISGYLEPLNYFLFSTIPSFLLAYHIRLVIDYVLVMVFSYLAARRWGISSLAAFFIGPAYILSFHWWYLSTTVVANSLFILPFVFWVYLMAKESGSIYHRFSWGILGGLGVGWAFLGGYAQFNVYTLFFLGIYAVYDFFVLSKSEFKTVRNALELSFVLLLFATVGYLIGYPVIKAASEYIPFTVRSGGVEYSLTQLKTLSIGELAFFVFPDYLRLPFITGGKRTVFIGILALAMAMVAILHVNKNRLTAILLGLFAFAFVLALPGSPIYYLLHKLPVFELFRFPHRWMYLGIWMLCVLSAIGFDFMRYKESDRRTQYVAIGFGAFASLVSFFVLLCTFFGEWFWTPVKNLAMWIFSNAVFNPATFPKGLDHYRGALERGIDAWRTLASLDNAYFAIPTVLLITSAIVFTLRAYGYLSRRHFEISAAIVLTVTFIGLFVARWPDSLPAETIFEHRRTAGDAIPHADLAMYRVYPFNNAASYRPRTSSLIWNTDDVLAGVELQHAVAAPNDHRYAGFLLVEGYDPFVARDLQQVFATLASNYSSEDLVKDIQPQDRPKQFLDHLDLVGMMSGRYVISGFELKHSDLKLIASPTASRYDIPYYIYEYSKAVPRVRLADRSESFPHSTVMEIVHDNKKFDRTYLDCEDCGGLGSRNSKMTVNSIMNGYFDISVDAKQGEWLIVSEQNLPGWFAAIDGKPAPITRANGMYMAIFIPEGTHRVIVQYEGIRGEASWLQYLGLFPHAILPK